MKQKHIWTVDQFEFVKKNLPGRKQSELLILLNEEFQTDIKPNQLRCFISNRKLKSGVVTRFDKGQIPFNKGKKKYWVGGEDTQFKKGHKPHNYMPVGSERINGDGYMDVKISDPNKWKAKHHLVWEGVNGPIPKNHVVIFGDGDRHNFEIDNLILVSRKQLVVMNKNGLIREHADLTRSGVLIADIHSKIAEKRRRKTK